MPPTALQPQLLDVRSDAHPWWGRHEEVPGAVGTVGTAAGVPRQRGPLPIGREEKARPATRPVPGPAPRPARADDAGAVRDGRSAHPPRPGVSPGRAGADVLRIVSDPRTPVFVTEHASGRRVYGYWRPLDADSGRGGCYVALSATECDELYAAGRITVGEPVTDPTKTTYRVRAARTQGPGARTQAAGARPAAAPVRTTTARGRAA
ncbi:cell envelope biogenesis protein OmpA [Streptomyces sp. NPDC002962]|uniref:cell envelope biogenesis protein OmpA n=1 Tax=Streptomyces sp. NPDC002962 TaxID=3364674 RepID=UPI003697FCD6